MPGAHLPRYSRKPFFTILHQPFFNFSVHHLHSVPKMSAIPSDFELSLRAWPKDDTGSALPTLIQRINTERGDFRNLTEDDLLAEIEKEEASGLNTTHEDDVSSESEDDAEPDRKSTRLNSSHWE